MGFAIGQQVFDYLGRFRRDQNSVYDLDAIKLRSLATIGDQCVGVVLVDQRIAHIRPAQRDTDNPPLRFTQVICPGRVPGLVRAMEIADTEMDDVPGHGAARLSFKLKI